MLNFPKDIIPTNKEERTEFNKKELEKRALFQARILKDMNEKFNIPIVNKLPLDIFPISQKNSQYSSLPYGKVGTIKYGGCGVLAVEYALRLLGFTINFEELINECVEKGYRGYIYNSNDKIIDGSGTKYSLFTNIATELTDLNQIFTYLQKGCPITILVANNVYHNDNGHMGNHFVTLVGIDENQNAVIMDGNKIRYNPLQAIVIKPIKELLLGLRGAWAWEKQKIMTYLN